jgi:hypothetical protein
LRGVLFPQSLTHLHERELRTRTALPLKININKKHQFIVISLVVKRYKAQSPAMFNIARRCKMKYVSIMTLHKVKWYNIFHNGEAPDSDVLFAQFS